MLSFERVLEAFREHLTEDTGVEVVLTRHGYTYLTWDDRRENWDTAEICLTPEALLDRLIGAVESYEQCRLLDGTRDPTDAERKAFVEAAERYRKRCLERPWLIYD